MIRVEPGFSSIVAAAAARRRHRRRAPPRPRTAAGPVPPAWDFIWPAVLDFDLRDHVRGDLVAEAADGRPGEAFHLDLAPPSRTSRIRPARPAAPAAPPAPAPGTRSAGGLLRGAAGPAPTFDLPAPPVFAWTGSAGGRPSALLPLRPHYSPVRPVRPVRPPRPPAPVPPWAPPTRPITASTWHLTVALLALSSVPYSTTSVNMSPRSTATVESLTGVPEKSRARRAFVPASRNEADRIGIASRSQGHKGRRRLVLTST